MRQARPPSLLRSVGLLLAGLVVSGRRRKAFEQGADPGDQHHDQNHR
jgi:hypothetical protein